MANGVTSSYTISNVSITWNVEKLVLYIRNLKYSHLTTIFRQHNIHLVSSTYKYKWILCTEKPVLNASFQDFLCTNINNHLFCFEKTVTTYLKTKNSLHATRISSFKYVFIVFFEKKQMLKYTFIYTFQGWSLDNITLLLKARSEALNLFLRNQAQRKSLSPSAVSLSSSRSNYLPGSSSSTGRQLFIYLIIYIFLSNIFMFLLSISIFPSGISISLFIFISFCLCSISLYFIYLSFYLVYQDFVYLL